MRTAGARHDGRGEGDGHHRPRRQLLHDYGGAPTGGTTSSSSSQLVDSTLIAPGSTFSFNRTTGERTAARGFR